MPLRRLGPPSHNKPRRALVLLLQLVQSRSTAGDDFCREREGPVAYSNFNVILSTNSDDDSSEFAFRNHFKMRRVSQIWSKTAKTPKGLETELVFQLRFERSVEIHSGEVEQDRVSSARAPRKLFCEISVTLVYYFDLYREVG